MSGLRVPSALPGVLWPAVPPARFQPLLSLIAQLQHSEWSPPDASAEAQAAQLAALLEQARRSPAWADRLRDTPTGPLSESDWRALPILERADLQAAGDALDAPLLRAHGHPQSVTTSGSTGAPVTVRRTGFEALLWSAITVRETLWHRRDPRGRLAIVRHAPAVPAEGARSRGWGPWAALFGAPGDVLSLDIGSDPERQLDALIAFDPHHLLTFPTHLGHLLDAADGRALPSLRAVSTLSEPVSAGLRDRLRAVWGAPLHDLYSAQECGYLAIQCPEHEHLHVQSEAVRLEVLDADGRPCGPGEIGRVVVTPLHALATPLIRYAIGDYAEVGAPCPCGRGLPVLTRVVGRERNSLVTASGARHWPFLGVPALVAALPSVRRVRVVQDRPGEAVAELVFASPPDGAALARAQQHFASHLRGFAVSVRAVDDLPRAASGKFEDVLCRVSGAPAGA